MTPRVLVTTVDPLAPGGVAAYWNAVRPCLASSVEYVVVGRRHDERGTIRIASRLLSDWRTLRNTLDASRFDLVHLNPSLLPMALLRDAVSLLAVRRRGLPVLVFIHGWDQRTEALLDGPALALFRRTYLRADAIIVLAREFERKLRRLGYTGPVHLSTTAVPDEAFEPAPERLPPDGIVRLLYLARFEPQKGAAETVRAFALLKKRHPGLELTMAGAGPELPAVSALIRDLGVSGVTLAGHVTGAAKARVFSEADVFVFPTFYGEGMPTVVLEAMARGLPVVTRTVGGIADFFKSGAMGYCTDSGEPEVIATLTERLVVDRQARKGMGKYNRQFARRTFHATVVADRLRSIYADVVARAGRKEGRS